MLSDRAPQQVGSTAQRQEHLVQMPGRAWLAARGLGATREARTELVASDAGVRGRVSRRPETGGCRYGRRHSCARSGQARSPSDAQRLQREGAVGAKPMEVRAFLGGHLPPNGHRSCMTGCWPLACRCRSRLLWFLGVVIGLFSTNVGPFSRNVG